MSEFNFRDGEGVECCCVAAAEQVMSVGAIAWSKLLVLTAAGEYMDAYGDVVIALLAG